MIDLNCPVCQARHESVLREHYERMIAIHEGHLARLIELRESHEQLVMRQAEWKAEQLEIVEGLHAEHMDGENDG